MTVHTAREQDDDEGILVVRRGPGANCSSIGSAVELLFLSATVGAAVLAAIAAAVAPEESANEGTGAPRTNDEPREDAP
jgi:hypothetical protein